MAITLSEVVGWMGSIFYVIAYLLLTLKKISSNNALYHFINILGALGLIINASHYRNYPSVGVNIAWLIIGMVAIVMIIRGKRNHANEAT